MKAPLLFIACLSFGLPVSLPAEVAAVHRDKLPQTTTVLAAYDDAQRFEHCVEYWVPKWHCDIPKEEITSTLSKDLGFLQLAIKDSPENVELRFLTALVAHYAYNVELHYAESIFNDALSLNNESFKQDLRAQWFRADLECQQGDQTIGMDRYLKIEKQYPPEKLPAGFWKNYALRATTTIMPAHTLRAIHYWRLAKPGKDDFRDFVEQTAKSRLYLYDPKKQYELQDGWFRTYNDKITTYKSYACDMSFDIKNSWSDFKFMFADGQCGFQIGTELYAGKTHGMRPTIMILARQQKTGETLKSYEQSILDPRKAESIPVEFCPARQCDEFFIREAGIYKNNGDAIGKFIFFEIDQPEFAGYAIETPLHYQDMENQKSDGVTLLHPTEHVGRMPGKLFYYVLLDAASPIEKPADEDFQYFLQHLIVE